MLDRRDLLLYVKCALDDEDIESLLAIGAPRDEYDPEASKIESRISVLLGNQSEVSAAHVAEIVADVWNSMFGPFDTEQIAKRQSAFDSVAKRILKSL